MFMCVFVHIANGLLLNFNLHNTYALSSFTDDICKVKCLKSHSCSVAKARYRVLFQNPYFPLMLLIALFIQVSLGN